MTKNLVKHYNKYSIWTVGDCSKRNKSINKEIQK